MGRGPCTAKQLTTFAVFAVFGVEHYRSCTLPPRLPPGVIVLTAHSGRKFCFISHGLVRITSLS
jgi:hypothetical protein